ncbi:hypothetical protein N665_0912s0005 [Sinapis alba]|nr:hypothetical protein N665_0912s0005 [Sinapis alba]
MEAKEAKAKEAKEAKAKEAKEGETSLCVAAVLSTTPEASAEASVVLMDKDKDTISDVQRHETRRHSQRESVLAVVRTRSERDRKLAASQQSPFQGNSTFKVIIPNTKVGHGYDAFAFPNKQKTKALTEWLNKIYIGEQLMNKNQRGVQHMDAYINFLRHRYTNNPNHFRSERMCFLDHVFSQMWRDKYGDIKSSTPDQNSLGKRLPGGSWDLYAGNGAFSHNGLLLLVKCAFSDEERFKYTLEPFTYARVKVGVPQCRGGDCGEYTLKYIECHAPGMTSFPAAFCDKNVKAIQDKMVHDIYHKTLGFEDIEISHLIIRLGCWSQNWSR